MKRKPAKKLQRKAMKKIKGGAEVARYHLENARSTKGPESPAIKSPP